MDALLFKSVKRYGIVRKKLCKNVKTSVDLSRLLHSTPYCLYACLAPIFSVGVHLSCRDTQSCIVGKRDFLEEPPFPNSKPQR